MKNLRDSWINCCCQWDERMEDKVGVTHMMENHMTENHMKSGGELRKQDGEVVGDLADEQFPSQNGDMKTSEKLAPSQATGTAQQDDRRSHTEEKKKPRVALYSAKEAELIRQLVRERLEQNEKLEFEELSDYEVPPRTQFSMLKKPALTIKYGMLKFNMACIRLFEGVQYIIPSINRKKRRIAAIMCYEEESGSVEWARLKDGQWINKDIRSDDYTESVFRLMKDWNRECRYKVLGRITQSERGLILVFDLDEAIMFKPKPEEYTDPVTGEVKKRQVKYYPDFYKDRIGRYYDDYAAVRQMNMFERIEEYTTDISGETEDKHNDQQG